VATAVIVAIGVAVPLRELSDLGRPKSAAAPSYEAGYWIRFPDQLTVSPVGFNATINLRTNLPDGTRYSYEGLGGGCCLQVRGGVISLGDGQNGSCYGLVGDTGDAEPFTETVTVAPEFNYAFIGIVSVRGSDPGHVTQPSSVSDVLGEHFENLTGDQVQQVPDGPGKELVASHTYSWPSPQCGGDPLPMFGGPKCPSNSQQLQGDNLDQAMTDVMGAISQARMCEFWQTDLTDEAAAAHPWQDFSTQWRTWFLDPPKDFNPNHRNIDTWAQSPLDWKLVRQDGSASVVDVTLSGTPVIELRVVPLPDHCPNCEPNVVPFWGVDSWTFLQS
jgi:hypothetical protein